jgi:hypothetical protein
MPPLPKLEVRMAEHKVECSFVARCEYGGYPSICKDCKRNRALKEKDQKYDCYQDKGEKSK